MKSRRKLSFFSSQEDVDAATLQDVSESLGAKPVADVEVGQIVKVHGAIRALRIRPNTNVPMVEAEIWDGSGVVTLIWLGRRAISGVTPGRGLVVEGRLTRGNSGQPTLFNPRYELLASGE